MSKFVEISVSSFWKMFHTISWHIAVSPPSLKDPKPSVIDRRKQHQVWPDIRDRWMVTSRGIVIVTVATKATEIAERRVRQSINKGRIRQKSLTQQTRREKRCSLQARIAKSDVFACSICSNVRTNQAWGAQSKAIQAAFEMTLSPIKYAKCLATRNGPSQKKVDMRAQ